MWLGNGKKKVARGFEPKYKSRNINYAESYLYKEYLINNNIELSEKQDYWLRKRESATGYINDETQMLGVKPTIFFEFVCTNWWVRNKKRIHIK